MESKMFMRMVPGRDPLFRVNLTIKIFNEKESNFD